MRPKEATVAERDNKPAEPERDRVATESYEPPRLEDLEAPEGTTVTPAGVHITTPAAPRNL
jgi:hypothetical protein